MVAAITPDQVPNLDDLAAYRTATANIESGGNPDAKNPSAGSTSSGLYGMTDPTYQGLLKLHPELAGKGKNDPDVVDSLTRDNAGYLASKLARPPNAVDLEVAHFLGAPTAANVLSADPNTPATSVVPQEFVLRNPKNFTNPDGSPKSVGQMYAEIGARMGMQNASIPAGATAPTGPQATAGLPTMQSMFPSPDAVYGPQKAAIASYIQSQPAMWQKLQQMQDQFQRSSQPTVWDTIDDGFNKYAQLNSVAQANKLASAGGVIFNANPNADSFVKALQAGHESDLQARNQRLALLKQAYDQSSGALLGQNQQQAQNLGLTGDLLKQSTDYGLATGKIGVELAKFGADQAKQLGDYVEKMVPNPETRAKVMAVFTSTANPTAPIATNMRTIDNLVQQAQDGTLPTPTANAPATNDTAGTPSPKLRINADKPSMVNFTYFSQDANNGQGGPKTETFDTTIPDDAARLKALQTANPAGTQSVATAPQNNITVNNGPAGGEGGGGASLADQHMSAIQTKQVADAALALLPYLQQHGGTGVLTDSDQGKTVANMIRQSTGFDGTAIPVRELFGKLMSQLQTSQTMAAMKGLGGRTTGGEFQKFLTGNVGADYTPEAIQNFLQHVSATSDWQQRKLEAQAQAEMQARQANNKYFDPANWQIQWQKQQGNQPPMWDTPALLDSAKPKPAPTVSGPVRAVPAPTVPLPQGTKIINGRTYQKVGDNWLDVTQDIPTDE